MKYPTFAAALCIAAACTIIGSVRAAEDAVPGLEGIPAVVAEVDGKPIPREELVRELVGSSGGKALERLVHRQLVEQAAAAQHVTVTDQDIEMQFSLDKRDLADSSVQGIRRLKLDDEVPVEETIRAQFGMGIPEYKNVIVRQRLLARRCMAGDIDPKEDELRRFFQAYPDLFQHPVLYRAQHILLSPLDPRDLFRGASWRTSSTVSQMSNYVERMREKSNEWRDKNINVDDTPKDEVDALWRKTRADAERLVHELQMNPSRWNEYVAKYSQDVMDKPVKDRDGKVRTQRTATGQLPGEVGWFHSRGPLVRAFYEGAKDIPPGQIGGPVRTQFGYHIIRMLEVRRPPFISYEECREKVRRMYIDNEIQLRSESWLAQLALRAELKTEKVTLWPPREARAAIGLPDANPNAETVERDPVVGRINGFELRRSEVWRELLRSEGEEALRRLINREVVLNILKVEGVKRMEWICADPQHRAPLAPPREAIIVKEDQIQSQLLDDRLEYDEMSHTQEYVELTFTEYIFHRYGQTETEYRRALEAGLVLNEAIREKVVPASAEDFERTLRFEFALARDQYYEDPWFEISHILIVPSGGMLKAGPGALLDARTIADNLYKQCLADPDKFGELVDQFSDDSAENKSAHGSLGGCYLGHVPPNLPEDLQFYNEISKQNLEAGQFTPPLQSGRGFHIVRLDRKHPGQQAEYNARMRKRVERDFINEQARHYADIWVRALNNRAIVKHFLYKPTLAFEETDGSALPQDDFKLPRE